MSHKHICECINCTCTPEKHCGCFTSSCSCQKTHIDEPCPVIIQQSPTDGNGTTSVKIIEDPLIPIGPIILNDKGKFIIGDTPPTDPDA